MKQLDPSNLDDVKACTVDAYRNHPLFANTDYERSELDAIKTIIKGYDAFRSREEMDLMCVFLSQHTTYGNDELGRIVHACWLYMQGMAISIRDGSWRQYVTRDEPEGSVVSGNTKLDVLWNAVKREAKL